MEAVDNMSFDAIKLLVNNGADVDRVDKYGVSALDKAFIRDYKSLHTFMENS